MWIRKFFLHFTSLLSNEAWVVFNTSSSHANTNLPNRRLPHEKFLIYKYSLILHALLHPQSHVLVFHKKSSLQELQSSNSLHSHQNSSWFLFYFELHTPRSIRIYTHPIHAKLKILFHLPLTLNTFTLIYFTLFGTYTWACRSSTVL